MYREHLVKAIESEVVLRVWVHLTTPRPLHFDADTARTIANSRRTGKKSLDSTMRHRIAANALSSFPHSFLARIDAFYFPLSL